jgi:hypothetical protein
VLQRALNRMRSLRTEIEELAEGHRPEENE